MPHTLTEAATYDATVTVPDDGDARNAASVNGAFQALADRTKFLNALVPNGLLIGGDRVRCPDTAALHVSGITQVVIGGVALSTASEITLAPSAGTLTASAWHYIYLYNNSGVVAIDVSTQVPDVGRVFKSGDTSRRYVGCFVTNASKAIFPFVAHRGRYQYQIGAQSAAFLQNFFRPLNGVTGSTALITASLAAWVPPHSLEAFLRVEFTPVASTSDSVQLRANGDLNFQYQSPSLNVAGVSAPRGYIQLATDTNQLIQYQVSASGDVLTVYVTGFQE